MEIVLEVYPKEHCLTTFQLASGNGWQCYLMWCHAWITFPQFNNDLFLPLIHVWGRYTLVPPQQLQDLTLLPPPLHMIWIPVILLLTFRILQSYFLKHSTLEAVPSFYRPLEPSFQWCPSLCHGKSFFLDCRTFLK